MSNVDGANEREIGTLADTINKKLYDRKTDDEILIWTSLYSAHGLKCSKWSLLTKKC